MSSTKEKRNLETTEELDAEIQPPAKRQRISSKAKKPDSETEAEYKEAEETEETKDNASTSTSTSTNMNTNFNNNKSKSSSNSKSNCNSNSNSNNTGNVDNEEEEEEDIDIYSIIFLTGNKGKLEEVKSFFNSKIGDLISNKKLDLEETQGTPKEIISKKLFAARKEVGNNVSILVEDTSLMLNAYSPENNGNIKNKDKDKDKEKEKENNNKNDNTSDLLGFPGPFIKFLLKWDKDGNEGLCKMVRGLSDKSGFALCIFGFLPSNSNKALFFAGKCDGNISDKPLIGKQGFGWDPVFVPKKDLNNNDNKKSFAQMTTDEKNAISHRGKALVKFKKYLENVYLKDMKK